MSEKKSYPDEMFEWRLNRYKGRKRTKLPHQEAAEACHRTNSLVDGVVTQLKFPDDFIISKEVGPSDNRVPANLFDAKIEYNEATKRATIVGSGGSVVLDHRTCMVDLARFLLDFTLPQSCGECTFCRIGTKRMHEILTRICAGKGRPEDIDTLLDLTDKLESTSLCELGKTASSPVTATLRHFRLDYEEHIRDQVCRAQKCELNSKAVK